VTSPGPLRRLLAALQRWLGRRRARSLLALGLPRASQAVAGALPGPRPTLPVSLRSPGPLEPPPGSAEQWALPLGAAAIRSPGKAPGRLFTLTILPAPARALGRLRLDRFRLDQEGRPTAQARAPSPALARPLTSQALATLDALDRRPAPGLHLRAPGAVAPGAFGLDDQFAPRWLRGALALERHRLPARWGLPLRHGPVLHELGVARPAVFHLDEEGLLPAERDAPVLALDRPAPLPARGPLPSRAARPFALLSQVSLRHFRLDPATASPANEGVVPPRPQPDACSWLDPHFDAEVCKLRWMARSWVGWLSSTPLELFTWWWLRSRETRLGAGEPREIKQSEELWYALWHHLKEQMLIRRDVTRDQEGPGLSTFEIYQAQPHIKAHSSLKRLDGLIPAKSWIERLSVATEPLFEEGRPVFDAYVQWRTLVNGLEER
jgi:hypothetical protein